MSVIDISRKTHYSLARNILYITYYIGIHPRHLLYWNNQLTCYYLALLDDVLH